MLLFILATYYYYCQDFAYVLTCTHNPPTGSTFRSIRLGNFTDSGRIFYLCFSMCIYHEDTNLYRPERFHYIFQGFGVYDESIQAEGLKCLSQKNECIWNYSMRTPQPTRTLQPTHQLKVHNTRSKKPKTVLSIFYKIILFE